MGKKYEGDTAEYVRKTYHVERNTQGFVIKSISDPATQMGTILIACKLMKKCQVTTVISFVIQLASQCAKRVCLNLAQYLCDEFLVNVCELQEQGNAFFYAWLLFLIALIAWETLAESVLPDLPPDMCEGARYAHLWDSKDT